MNRAMKMFWMGLAGFGVVLAVLLAPGCSTLANGPDTGGGSSNNIPRLALVEPGIYRGGQPDASGWIWLRQAGVSNVVKLNPMDEGSDAPAAAMGMTIQYYPIDTLQQLITGPSADVVAAALRGITPGTYIHCLHGEDRTGLVVGLYRLSEGTNAPAAYQEMLRHGYHPALRGLTKFWQSQTSGDGIAERGESVWK